MFDHSWRQPCWAGRRQSRGEQQFIHPRHPSEGWDRWPLDETLEQIGAVGIVLLDEPDLPVALPRLERFLSCSRRQKFGMRFHQDMAVQAVASTERRTGSRPMLRNACRNVAGHANVENTARFVGENVRPAAHDERV